jgi:hypothetical protein
MREVEVGCKIPEGGGMEAFGDQEVADLLSKGWRVVEDRRSMMEDRRSRFLIRVHRCPRAIPAPLPPPGTCSNFKAELLSPSLTHETGFLLPRQTADRAPATTRGFIVADARGCDL